MIHVLDPIYKSGYRFCHTAVLAWGEQAAIELELSNPELIAKSPKDQQTDIILDTLSWQSENVDQIYSFSCVLCLANKKLSQL